jgi:hypothetical protein
MIVNSGTHNPVHAQSAVKFTAAFGNGELELIHGSQTQ